MSGTSDGIVNQIVSLIISGRTNDKDIIRRLNDLVYSDNTPISELDKIRIVSQIDNKIGEMRLSELEVEKYKVMMKKVLSVFK